MPDFEKKKPFAKRSFGQNFLSDRSVVQKIVRALDLTQNDKVIEIGPGRGDLTVELLATGADLTSIELDRDLIPILTDRFKDADNFRLINQDILTVDLSEIYPCKVKIVGNLPYNISTPILRLLIEQSETFSQAVLMFQREVVDRIVARPGEKERGFLSVLCEKYIDSKRIMDVSPGSFRPAPKVWSSVVKIIPKPGTFDDREMFIPVISAGFAQRRKTILNNLKAKYPSASEILDRANVEARLRAQDLTLEQWNSITSSAIDGEAN